MAPILGIWASAQQSAAATSYESIATVTVGSGGASSADFTSIPSTYTHLQLRAFGRVTGTGNRDSFLIRFNTDSGNNYWWHQLQGNGSAASSENAGSITNRGVIGTTSVPIADAPANVFGAAVIDILDYANTNKYKTVRGLAGQDQNSTDGRIQFGSFMWNNTSAITSISIYSGTNWLQYSSFALYGIK